MLVLPFLTLIESVGYFKFYELNMEQSNLLTKINLYWNFFALFWIIPYTILALFLLLWSRNKTLEQIRNNYVMAPVMMTVLASLFYIILAIVVANGERPESAMFLIFASAVSIPASIVFGYIFVVISLVCHEIFQKLGIVRD